MELRARTSKGVVARSASDDDSGRKHELAPGARTKSSITRHTRRLPAGFQFPLVVVLSFAISALSYALLGQLTKGELAGVSRSLDSWTEVTVIAGWRTYDIPSAKITNVGSYQILMFELALGWFGNLDSYDLAALNILGRGPPLYLLATFYEVSPTTAMSAVVIDIASAFIPFQLLRPLSEAHQGSESVPNGEIIADPSIQVYTTTLAAVIYTVTLLFAYRLYLPATLVVNFEGLKTMVPVYTSTYISILPAAGFFGLAAKTFIFTPYAATGPSSEDENLLEFDPVEASLGETAWFSLWGYTARTKVVIIRTTIAVLTTYVNTYLQTSLTIAGVESVGASSYAKVWAAAALMTGIGLGLVGRA